MRKSSLLASAAMAALTISSLSQAKADAYTYSSIPSNFTVESVNPDGSANVIDYNAPGGNQGTITNGVFTPKAYPVTPTSVYSDEDFVDVKTGSFTGFYTGPGNSGNSYSTFLDVNGAVTKILPPDGQGAPTILGLNDNNALVGTYNDGTSAGGYFEYNNGIYTTLSLPLENYTINNVYGISNSDTVFGLAQSSAGYAGFTYKDGIYTLADVPNSFFTDIQSVSDTGTVYGISYDDSYTPTAFSDTDGVYTTLNPTGYDGTLTPSFVTSSGTVIEQVTSSDGSTQYVQATNTSQSPPGPVGSTGESGTSTDVPEPGAMPALMGLAFLTMVVATVRSRRLGSTKI